LGSIGEENDFDRRDAVLTGMQNSFGRALN